MDLRITFYDPKDSLHSQTKLRTVPDTILYDVAIKYAHDFYDVDIDCSMNNFFNFFGDTVINLYEEDDDFINMVREKYLSSRFYKHDLEVWLEDEND